MPHKIANWLTIDTIVFSKTIPMDSKGTDYVFDSFPS